MVQKIIKIGIDNSAYDTSRSLYDANSTNDKIFLLSYSEAMNTSYFTDCGTRQTAGSTYAKAQGLSVNTASGLSDWRLRSAGYNSNNITVVNYADGNIYADWYANHMSIGIRPAFCFSPSAICSECFHQLSDWIIYDFPTCGLAGSRYKKCIYCGETIETDSVPATGNHAWNDGVITDNATCHKEGAMTFTCTVCKTTKTEKTAKTYHEPSEWQTDYNPTCTSGGSRHIECLSCHEILNREAIPAIGHHDHDGDGYCDTCSINMEDYLRSICTCNCHKSGFAKFIWKILNFFYKLFGIKQYCSCGAKHW